jgi:glutamate synthase domain-containing protein 2/glutamate synthase domain-containing protein 1/glutamate synthase domain-containing protein 3
VARVDGRPSREIVEEGVEILRNLAHRGATGSDPETGDGAGILLQVPHEFLRQECRRLGVELPGAGGYAAGMLFLTNDPDRRRQCELELERIAAEAGHPVLGWRDVPVAPDQIGALARRAAPQVRQVFLARNGKDRDAFERKLYVIRRQLHRRILEAHGEADACYVASLSSSTVVYKGLLKGPQVSQFYLDLQDPRLTSALALVHSRFSTNTLGSWRLAHPYRYIAHNGEINTLRGNLNWMRARESQLRSAAFGPDLDTIRPIVLGESDSAAFDNTLELLVLSGRSLPHSIMLMMPEAWENDDLMERERRGFYRYHSALMEPWDGPAAIAFTDGRLIGATLDRNGLRPARYSLTRDGRVILASEEGVLPIPPEDVTHRGRLQPGRMLVVDTAAHRVLDDEEAKRPVIQAQPYGRWAEEGTFRLGELPAGHLEAPTEPASPLERKRAFGYTLEDVQLLLLPMAAEGKEPDGSMGTDTPLAVLSEQPQLLFSYFKQLFAQVTNPPIDPLREDLVMSLAMSLGPELNLLEESADHCRRVQLDQPILVDADLRRLRSLDRPPFRAQTLPALFPAAEGSEGFARAIESLCDRAGELVADGVSILVLSDRRASRELAPLPSLLATSAVHQHLVRHGLRTRAALVVETGEAREVHHFALLIGFGAVAVNPYLALETVASLAEKGRLEGLSPRTACENYRQAIGKGLRKVMSKMGISTLSSYHGAQIFEAVGLDRDLVDRHFTGTASRLGGAGLQELAAEALERHEQAFTDLPVRPPELEVGGQYQLREQGEYHQWNPLSIVSLQRAVRTGSFESFRQYAEHFEAGNARLATLRGLLDFELAPIPPDDVEPESEIVKRFATGAMSFGSLSREAHETLAIAMNRIGGRSNTGEGGEDADRFTPDESGDSRRSAIKQVASARFGVTAHYLVNADVLQIKMAQGSKPGEGGQLPGNKVSKEIAGVRYSTPGIGLISPPPHHDIYSIEDLAQLIHDLKSANPDADVSVKLVSEVGIGTIAAGVAKAKADHITISGHDGGTGASPLSSIKHAGLPWELGLAEAQQALVENGLRGRVRLQTDGQLKTGRDVVVAALLGAEEFAFSTAPLVALGCILMRVCHLNTCPVGIATQDPVLRERFTGLPEHVIRYFFFLAGEVRALMADLGFRRFDDMVGRSDRLRLRRGTRHRKAASLDLSPLLLRPDAPRERSLRKREGQDHGLERDLDVHLIEAARPALEWRQPVKMQFQIRNTHRSIGARLSGEIARRHGAEGLPEGTIRVHFRGTAGQSFGAWGARGLTLLLEGVANDYPGKGLSGARLVVFPPPSAGHRAEDAIVVGNVALYGATDGEAFFSGLAGERFAVRNSGARAVVEGVGDHGCEYMTGGVVVVLGPTGRNFAAGMSGGVAFVLDTEDRFRLVCNQSMVAIEPLEDPEDMVLLHRLVSSHFEHTGSRVAERVLTRWRQHLPLFLKVMPHDLRKALEDGRRDVRAEVG